MGFLAEGREAEKMAGRMIAALRNFLQHDIQLEGLNFKDIQVNPFNNSLNDLIADIGLRGISATVQMPRDYVLFNRTITLLLGICHSLEADLNPLDTVRPYAQKYLLEAQGGTLGFIKNILQRNLTNLISLPGEVQRTLAQARRGDVEIRTPDIANGARLLYLGLQQFIWAGLAVISAWFALHCSEVGRHESVRWVSWVAMGCFLVFLWKTWQGRRLRRRL